MTIKVLDVLDEDLATQAWQIYVAAFQELNYLAVQRHLMYRHEFDDVMRDARVQKYLCLTDDGQIGGVASYTNHLDALPLLSPQYFERRWPKLYAEKRIWYCGFIAIDPERRDGAVLTELVEGMYRTAANQEGIIGLDICRHNDATRRMGKVGELILRRCAGAVQATRVDEQTYWMYEFPAAAAPPAHSNGHGAVHSVGTPHAEPVPH